MSNQQEMGQLKELLEKRLRIIADHDLRDQDPVLQLQQLQEVSESISELAEILKPGVEPRLRHYLQQASYGKALDWLNQVG